MDELKPTVTTDKLNRFWSRVDKSGSCWIWDGAVQSRGYGHFVIGGKNILAHRYAWATTNGPIPSAIVIDHRCRVRRCVNPAHMDLVTTKENTMRGIGPTAVNARKICCPNGHVYTRFFKGKRYCRPCRHKKTRVS